MLPRVGLWSDGSVWQ